MAEKESGIRGVIGVGTWATEAEFKDIEVFQDGRTLFESDFSRGMKDWTVGGGEWNVVDGALRQTSQETDCRALIGDPDWSNYTLTLKARKLSGKEGFLILFGLPDVDSNIQSWWNLGGWANTQHALQVPGVAADRVRGRIENDRWYDIKVELAGNRVNAYLDGQLVQSGTIPSDEDAQREFPHALVPDMVADPGVVEFDGTFYLYGTTDGMGRGLATAGMPVVWTSKDFLHWSFDGSIFPDNFDAKYWAPSMPIKKDGKYYLFPTLDNHITALVAPSPKGPFKTLDGKDITKTSGWRQMEINVGHPIDAELLLDDDGSYYMVWSKRYIAKMNDDFSGFDGEPVLLNTKRGGYSEGPQIFKRNGIYYHLYTLGGSESYQYAYMMSHDSVLGPWTAPENDIISTTDREEGIFGPGHGSFFNLPGTDEWVFVYLEYGRSGTNRQTLSARVHFNPDGTIQPIELTLEGVGALRDDPRYSTPNLALDAKAAASSVRDDQRIPPIKDPLLNRIETFAPRNAVDASNGSRWMAANDDAQPWFAVDLGEVRDVKRTELCFVKPTEGHAYRLEYSVDGKEWKDAAQHSEVRKQSPHVDEIAVQARYLKVTILQGERGLWEFCVY